MMLQKKYKRKGAHGDESRVAGDVANNGSLFPGVSQVQKELRLDVKGESPFRQGPKGVLVAGEGPEEGEGLRRKLPPQRSSSSCAKAFRPLLVGGWAQ